MSLILSGNVYDFCTAWLKPAVLKPFTASAQQAPLGLSFDTLVDGYFLLTN